MIFKFCGTGRPLTAPAAARSGSHSCSGWQIPRGQFEYHAIGSSLARRTTVTAAAHGHCGSCDGRWTVRHAGRLSQRLPFPSLPRLLLAGDRPAVCHDLPVPLSRSRPAGDRPAGAGGAGGPAVRGRTASGTEIQGLVKAWPGEAVYDDSTMMSRQRWFVFKFRGTHH